MKDFFFKDKHTLFIIGEITWERLNGLYEDYLATVENYPPSNDLVVFISSQGGDRDAGISLMSFLRSLEVRLTTIAFGKVLSAGVYPFLASPDRRYAIADTTFLFHPTTFELGETANTNTLQESINCDNADIESFKKILEQLQIPQPMLNSLANPQTSIILTAEAAHHYGLVNHVIRKFTEVTF